MYELVRLYREFRQSTAVTLGNEHDFPHFMAWLENQILLQSAPTSNKRGQE